MLLDDLPRTGKGYREAAVVVEKELGRLWGQAVDAVARRFPLRLEDGTARSGMIALPDARPAQGLRPWPDEPWAEGPLGPLYKDGRTQPIPA